MSDVKLYDRLLSKAVIVLGGDAAGNLVVRYENALDDITCPVDEKILRCSPDFVAICAHNYTSNDSCPGCDADYDTLINKVERYGVEVSDHIGQSLGQPSTELGMIYQHADCTWSAVTPSGVILGSNIVDADSAVRALRLDHKIRVWFTALNDNVQSHTVRVDELITAPAGLWDRPALTTIGMTAAEAFDIIDFAQPTPLDHAAMLGSLEHTHPVRTTKHDGSAL